MNYIGRFSILIAFCTIVRVVLASEAPEDYSEVLCDEKRCFYYVGESGLKVTHPDARHMCELAEVRDQQSQTLLQDVLKKGKMPDYRYAWIGGTREGEGKDWRWIDGRVIADWGELDWAKADTKLDVCGLLCIEKENCHIAKHNCQEKQYVVCASDQKHAVRFSEKGDVATSFLLNDTWYFTSVKDMTWFEAQLWCNRNSASLLTTGSAADLVYLQSLLLNKLSNDAWMGASGAFWRWNTDGSAVLFTNWEENRPDDDDARCLAVNYLGEWLDKDCEGDTSVLRYVCQTVNETTTTVQTTTSMTTTPTPTSFRNTTMNTNPNGIEQSRTRTTVSQKPQTTIAAGEQSASDNDDKTTIIAGAAAAGAVFVIMVVIVVIIIIRKKKKVPTATLR